MTNSFVKGITLVEVVLVIVVLGIIFSIALPEFAKMRERQVLKSGVEEIISSVNKARSRTLASINSFSYGVHFESDKVIIFKGTSFSSGDANNETVNIVAPASISPINLSGGASDIYFNRLSGAPNITGNVVISTTNFTKTITISATGIASVN